jgi:hypothetical protein
MNLPKEVNIFITFILHMDHNVVHLEIVLMV